MTIHSGHTFSLDILLAVTTIDIPKDFLIPKKSSIMFQLFDQKSRKPKSKIVNKTLTVTWNFKYSNVYYVV